MVTNFVKLAIIKTGRGFVTTRRAVGTNRVDYRISSATIGVVARNNPGGNVKTSSAAETRFGNSGGANASDNYSNKGV
jgi:hypothetical protein